jgi:hypothetical protein
MEIKLVDSMNLQNGTTAMDNDSFSANNYLREKLQSSVLNVTFVKKDGTERKMTCTLKADHLPAQTDLEEAVQKKAPNSDVIAVWDVEKAAWRSFRYDSIIGFTEASE